MGGRDITVHGEAGPDQPAGAGAPPGPDERDQDEARYAARTAELKARIAELAAGPDPAQQEALAADEAALQDRVRNAVEQAVGEAVGRTLPGALLAGLGSDLQDLVARAAEAGVHEALPEPQPPDEEGGAGVEPRLAALEDALDGVGERLESMARDGISTLAETMDELGRKVATLTELVLARPAEPPAAAAGASKADVDELLGLRADLADALEYLRDAVVVPLRGELASLRSDVQTQITESLTQVHVEVEGMAATALGGVQDEVFGGARDAVAAALAELRDRPVATPAAGQDVTAFGAGEQSAALVELREQFIAALAELHDRQIDQIRELAEVRSAVTGMGERLSAVGRALLDHLAGRDLLLEQVRDEHAAQLLSDVLAGLGPAERGAATQRAAGLLQRRREARDAARWRAGRPATPTRPPDVAEEDELVRLLEDAGAGEGGFISGDIALPGGGTGAAPGQDPGPAGPATGR